MRYGAGDDYQPDVEVHREVESGQAVYQTSAVYGGGRGTNSADSDLHQCLRYSLLHTKGSETRNGRALGEVPPCSAAVLRKKS